MRRCCSSPYQGGAPVTVDDTRARQVAGVTDVVRLPGGVGVIGTSVEATQAAKEICSAVASAEDAPGGELRQRTRARRFRCRGPGHEPQRRRLLQVRGRGIGDARRGKDHACRTPHAPRLPCTDGAAECDRLGRRRRQVGRGVGGRRGPSGLISELAGLLQTEPGRITVHQQWVGGGYGRRSQNEVVMDAVRLSKAVGTTVKLIWSREDDIRGGKFRPSTAHLIEAGLDADGRIVAWHRRVVAESVVNYMAAARGGTPPRVDQIVMKGSPVPMYAIPNKRAEHIVELRGRGLRRCVVWAMRRMPSPSKVSWMTSRSRPATPLAIRLEFCANAPRTAHLVRTVTGMSDWDPRDGRGLGLAIDGEGRHPGGRRGRGLGRSRHRQDQGPQFPRPRSMPASPCSRDNVRGAAPRAASSGRSAMCCASRSPSRTARSRLDTRSDLMDLLFWMRSGIARIGLDLIDKLHDQLHKRLLLPLWLHADASGAAVFLMFDWGWSAQIRRRLLLATDNERPLALASLRRALPHRSGGHCPQI